MRQFWLAPLLLLMCACSQQPSQADAKQAFEARISKDSGGVVHNVTTFEKTNGQSLEVNGVKAYRFFYHATVVFPNGLRPECIRDDGGFAGFDCSFAVMQSAGGISPKPVGARVTYRGEINFEQLERGWQVGRVAYQQESMVVPPPPPPTKAEQEAGKQQQRTEISTSLAACRLVVTTAQFDQLKNAGPVEPVANRVAIGTNGGFKWNSLDVDEATLGQYLEQASQISPQPHLIFDPSGDETRNEAIRAIIYRSGFCG